MRFNRPYNLDHRIRRWFALLPVTCGHETRWLEWVTVEQCYLPNTYLFAWHNWNFVDEAEP